MGDININNYDIKLHKTDGKKIKTGNLEGIRVTDQNKSIFAGHVCDIDNDGIASEKEKQLAQSLKQAAADGIISGEETKVLYEYLDIMTGRDNTIGKDDFHASNTALHDDLFKGLVDIADQQAHWNNGAKTYEYTLDGKKIETSKDRSEEIITNTDGTIEYKTIITEGGETINSVETYKDRQSLEAGKPNTRLQTITTENGVENTFSECTYNEDGTTVTVTYNGTDNTGECTGVTKGGMKGTVPKFGFESEVDISVIYATVEDMNNNIPSSVMYDPAGDGNSVIVNLTPVEGKEGVYKATYEKDGQSVEEEVTLKDLGLVKESKDEKVEEKPTEPTYTEYTVPKNWSNDRIAKQALIDAGIENPTAEQIKTAREAIEAANQDQLKVTTGKGKGISWGKASDAQKEGGRTYFYADAKIKMPDKATLLGETKPADGTEGSPDAAATGGTYTVNKGDSLWKIAVGQLGENATAGEIYNYMKELASVNGLTIDVNGMCMIRPGDELKLPGSTEEVDDASKTGQTDKPEGSTEVKTGEYILDNDAVYKELADTAKAKYKEFMDKWTEGGTYKVDDDNNPDTPAIEFTMLTRPDGQRVLVQGVMHYEIGADDNAVSPKTDKVVHSEGDKVTYKDVEYTRKTIDIGEGGTRYYLVGSDGTTSYGINDLGEPFTPEKGKYVSPFGSDQMFEVVEQNGKLYYKALDETNTPLYEIQMPDYSKGAKVD